MPAENLRVGPCYTFIGDPTVADGMNYLGKTRGDVTVATNAEIAVGRADQQGVTPLAGSVFFSGIAPVVTVPFVDKDKEKMNLIYNNSNIETASDLSAIGFGSGFRKIDKGDLKTLCLLPVRDLDDYEGANGVADPDAFWLQRVVARDYGEFTFNLPEGDDVLNPHEVQFAGLHVNTDQADADIPESMRVMFQGPPAAGGLDWNLPDLNALNL